MFLQRIADNKLLDPTEDLCVMKDMPARFGLPLCDTLVQYLIDRKNEKSMLLTKEHVEWAMEILGHAFNLDINSKSDIVLDNAIEIYKRWIVPDNKYFPPKPIRQYPEYFTTKMCKHLSCVFRIRHDIRPDSEEFQTHKKLCKRVLGVYSTSARYPPGNYKTHEWNEYLAKIFIGICGEVVYGPAETRSLGNDIEQDVFFNLFDIWLRAQMQNETLWKLLKKYSDDRWIHRQWFIEGWGQSCVALTRRLIAMLHGGNNGSNVVTIKWPIFGKSPVSIPSMLEGRGSRMAPTKVAVALLPELNMTSSEPSGTNNNNNNENSYDNNNDNDSNNYNSNNNYNSKFENRHQSAQLGANKNKNKNRHLSKGHSLSPRGMINGINSSNIIDEQQSGNSDDGFTMSSNSTANINDTNVSTNNRHRKSNSSSNTRYNNHSPRNVLSEVAYTSSLKYGQTVNSMSLCIQVDESRLLIYLWNKMLNVLDIGRLNDPTCFGTGIAWIARMVDLFLSVSITCGQRRAGLVPPNGNSILKIFAKKLFPAAKTINGFESARAIALGALCRIFCQKPETRFHENYLLEFYNTLDDLLGKEGHTNKSVSGDNNLSGASRSANGILSATEEAGKEQVILNAATLFACDFKGCRALVPVFLPHIGLVLRKAMKDRLRLAAITMLCSVISLEWHFWGNKSSNKNESNNRRRLKERLKLVPTILYDAFSSEHNEYNQQKLLWTTCVYLHVCAYNTSNKRPFPSNLVYLIWRQMQRGIWPVHVVQIAFKVLKSIATIDHNDAKLGQKLVIEFCGYAVEHLTQGQTGQRTDLNFRRMLAVHCMKCVLAWIQGSPQLLTFTKVSNHIKHLIRSAMKIRIPRVRPTGHNDPSSAWTAMSDAASKRSAVQLVDESEVIKDIHRAADQLARYFVNDAGSYCDLTHTPLHRFATTCLNERQLIEQIINFIKENENEYDITKWNPNDRVRHFGYKKQRIITLIEMPRKRRELLQQKTIHMHNNKDAVMTPGVAAIASPVLKNNPLTLTPAQPIAIKEFGSLNEEKTDSNNAPKTPKVVSPRVQEALNKFKLDDSNTDDATDTTTTTTSPNTSAQLKSSSTSLATSAKTSPMASDSKSGNDSGRERGGGKTRNTVDLTENKENNSSDLTKLIDIKPSTEVIILIRDAYGKYAWEARCIYDDNEDISSNGTGLNQSGNGNANDGSLTNQNLSKIIGSSSNGGGNDGNHRGSYGSMRQDLFQKALSKYQITAQYSLFRDAENEKKSYKEKENLPDDGYKYENDSNCDAAYWSSTFVSDNWEYRSNQEQNIKKLKQKMKEQNATESKICEYYKLAHRHPSNRENEPASGLSPSLTSVKTVAAAVSSAASSNDDDNDRNGNHLSSRQKAKWIASKLKQMPTPPYKNKDSMFNASTPPPLPVQDESATFMHSRRLLSTLGFLTPDSMGALPKYLDVLHDSVAVGGGPWLGYSNILQARLENLDRIELLDQISVAILVHETSTSNNKKNNYNFGPQLSDYDMLRNDTSSHSDEFKSFIYGMSNLVDLDAHVGYTGCVTIRDSDRLSYYANQNYEIAFHIPSTMEKIGFERKKDIYLSNCVRIIWSDSLEPLWLTTRYVPDKTYYDRRHPDHNTPVIYIRITKQSMGLYRITVHGDSVLPHLQGHAHNGNKSSPHGMNGDYGSSNNLHSNAGGQYGASLSGSSGGNNNNNNNNGSGSNVDTKRGIYFEDSLSFLSNIKSSNKYASAIPTTRFDDLLIGPLVDGMVVSEAMLPQLVRETVVNASIFISEMMGDSRIDLSKHVREKEIYHICKDFEQYRNDKRREKYYKYFFVNSDLKMNPHLVQATLASLRETSI